jgi:protein TonB
LRDFFAIQRLHYGTLEDIATLAARLDASGSFRDELSSMVRVILVREGGSVPSADLLEIVIIAIAGADIGGAGIAKVSQAAQQTVIHPPVQQIVAFLNGVLHKPWNEAPGEVGLQPEPVLEDDAALKSSPVAPGICMPLESELPQEEDEPRNIVEEKPAQPIADVARPESIYARFIAEMQAIAAQAPELTTSNPAPVSESSTVPERNFAREPDSSSESEAIIADEVSLQSEPLPVYTSPVQIYSSEIEPRPEPIVEPPNHPPGVNNSFPPPVPAAAVESRSRPASTPPPSTLDPEPPSPSAFHLPHPKLGPLRFPRAGRITANQIRIALLSPVAASVFIAALMYPARRHSSSVMRAADLPVATPAVETVATSAQDSPSVTAASTTVATSPEAPSIPTPASAPDSATAPPYATRRSHDDYVAPPFSIPIPPESAVRTSTPAPSAPPLASFQSKKTDKLVEIASSSAIQSRPVNVSSNVMAGNLLSAPAPRYPVLAKVVHLQGQVVVEAVVDRNGNVSRARVLSGHRLLRGATVDEVLSRRYRPYLVHGQPVEVSTTITLDFPPGWTPSLSQQTASYADLQTR